MRFAPLLRARPSTAKWNRKTRLCRSASRTSPSRWRRSCGGPSRPSGRSPPGREARRAIGSASSDTRSARSAPELTAAAWIGHVRRRACPHISHASGYGEVCACCKLGGFQSRNRNPIFKRPTAAAPRGTRQATVHSWKTPRGSRLITPLGPVIQAQVCSVPNSCGCSPAHGQRPPPPSNKRGPGPSHIRERSLPSGRSGRGGLNPVTTPSRRETDLKTFRKLAGSVTPRKMSWSTGDGKSGSYGVGPLCPSGGRIF